MTNEFFHTYNRGTEKRIIFLDKQDYFRAVHDIYEFNDANITLNLGYYLEKKNRQTYWSSTPIDGASISGGMNNKHNERKSRNLLVNLFCWVLMPNHYHIFSEVRNAGGISKFHQKWGTGYANYFNLKYERNGGLFQGRYKKVMVKNNDQAAHLVCYIHSNLLDLWKPKWKEKGITDLELQNAIKFLNDKKNRWSSHQDYWGIKNFPSLTSREFLDKFFGGSKGYRDFFISWLKQYQQNVNLIKKLILD